MPPILQSKLGALTCRRVGTAQMPDLIVILCHGFGAPGMDLVPLGEELVSLVPSIDGRVWFLFPEAPLQLDDLGIPGGRAWWPIDMWKLQRAIQLGEFRNLRNDQPELLPVARQKLMSLIEAVQTETGLPLSRIVLGGFSQGAMLATDVALHLEASAAALIIWSGTLLNEPEWSVLAPRRAGLTVLQSHGYEDTILPFEAAEWLRDLLQRSGANVKFLPFHGGHSIDWSALRETAKLLERLLSSSP